MFLMSGLEVVVAPPIGYSFVMYPIPLFKLVSVVAEAFQLPPRQV